MSSSHRTSPHDNRHLLLRVYRQDQLGEEHYIANGLSIGRSEANQIQIDEMGIGRAHARIARTDAGQFILRPVSSELSIKQNGQSVPEVVLTVGQQFEIGSVQFECFSNKQEPAIMQGASLPCCPHCQETLQANDNPYPQTCGHCLERIFIIPHAPGSAHLIALPVYYGKYEGERFIARGGMGFVFRGFNTEEPTQNIAIKVLKAANTGVTTSDMQRFRSEITLMRQIDNPHVMPLLSYGNSHRHNYLVMPWLGSPTLREKIALWKTQQTPPRFEEALPLFWGICQGVKSIHAQGIVHRDLKPANILFEASDRPVVADLGIAQSNLIGQGDTKTGMVLGSSDYMSPEQRWQPDKVDHRADLYALGVIFYEVLTLAHPTGAWQPASAINPSVPQEFDRVITALLCNDLKERISSIDLVMVWLKTFPIRNILDKSSSNQDGSVEKLPEIQSEHGVSTREKHSSISEIANNQSGIIEPRNNDDDNDTITIKIPKGIKSLFTGLAIYLLIRVYPLAFKNIFDAEGYEKFVHYGILSALLFNVIDRLSWQYYRKNAGYSLLYFFLYALSFVILKYAFIPNVNLFLCFLFLFMEILLIGYQAFNYLKYYFDDIIF